MGIIQASIPLFFLLIAAELLYARFGRQSLYRLSDSIADLSAGTLSQIAGIFTKLLLGASYAWTFEHLRLDRWTTAYRWPDGTALTWVNAVAWSAAFVLVDLAYYWFHRVSHEVNVFWAGHIVHHSSEEYNLAVALRQSAVGGLLSWVFYIPLAVLGIPLEQFVVCYALNLIYQFWIHTRVIDRLPRWAEAVLNTPSHHRVHHGVNPEYQDRNYAGVFIVWDRWFGTFTPERDAPVYGLTTPLASWNPLWAQVHQYVAIARAVARRDTWRDRWMSVFGSPAWRPLAEGGPVRIPPVSTRALLKYDPAVPTRLSQYALAHFALALPPALWLLARSDQLALPALAAGGFYVVLTLTNVGGVLEARRWALSAERARMLTLILVAVLLGARDALPLWLVVACGMVGVVSLAVLHARRDDFTTPSDERMDVTHRQPT